jgi:hypothetical protein
MDQMLLNTKHNGSEGLVWRQRRESRKRKKSPNIGGAMLNVRAILGCDNKAEYSTELSSSLFETSILANCQLGGGVSPNFLHFLLTDSLYDELSILFFNGLIDVVAFVLSERCMFDGGWKGLFTADFRHRETRGGTASAPSTIVCGSPSQQKSPWSQRFFRD